MRCQGWEGETFQGFRSSGTVWDALLDWHWGLQVYALCLVGELKWHTTPCRSTTGQASPQTATLAPYTTSLLCALYHLILGLAHINLWYLNNGNQSDFLKTLFSSVQKREHQKVPLMEKVLYIREGNTFKLI